MEAQFGTFNDAAQVTSFSALSASIFKWLEEECKPQVWNHVIWSRAICSEQGLGCNILVWKSYNKNRNL